MIAITIDKDANISTAIYISPALPFVMFRTTARSQINPISVLVFYLAALCAVFTVSAPDLVRLCFER